MIGPSARGVATTTTTILRNALLLGVEHYGPGTDAEHYRHPLVVDLHPFDERPHDPSALLSFQPVEVGAHRPGKVLELTDQQT
jgi:hypothetical protein